MSWIMLQIKNFKIDCTVLFPKKLSNIFCCTMELVQIVLHLAKVASKNLKSGREDRKVSLRANRRSVP